MTTSVSLEGARVIAAMTPPISKAALNRGQVIVCASDGTIVRAETYTGEGGVEGPVLTKEELQGLIEAGHVTELPGWIPAVPGASLWVLRGGLPRRDRALTDLKMSGLLVHPPLIGHGDARLCVVREGQTEASGMRDRWRDEAMAEAKRHAERGAWDLATADAEIAQAVCRGLDPEVLGLLSLVYERCGRTERTAGLLVMARRSRGDDFEAQVVRAREHFQSTLNTNQSTRAQARADLDAALREHFPNLAQSLGKPRSCRLAAA